MLCYLDECIVFFLDFFGIRLSGFYLCIVISFELNGNVLNFFIFFNCRICVIF